MRHCEPNVRDRHADQMKCCGLNSTMNESSTGCEKDRRSKKGRKGQGYPGENIINSGRNREVVDVGSDLTHLKPHQSRGPNSRDEVANARLHGRPILEPLIMRSLTGASIKASRLNRFHCQLLCSRSFSALPRSVWFPVMLHRELCV